MTHVTNQNDFFVVLPSNSSTKYFPKNTPQSYKVKLAKPISLHGSWEVALAEISYQRTWRNLIGYNSVHLVSGKKVSSGSILPGHYEAPETLIDELNAVLNEHGVKFSYSQLSKHCTVEVENLDSVLYIDSELRDILGFTVLDDDNVLTSDGLANFRVESKYPVDLARGFHSMYIYTDIIESVLVGDSNVPLLKILPVAKTYGEVVHLMFDRMHYTELRTSHFDTVEINISDDTGKPVPFTYGKTILKLHFRPRKPAYL